MIRISQSLIKAFNCPMRGKYLVDRDKRYQAYGPGLTGQALHRFAEKYLFHLHEGGLETDPSFYEQVLPIGAEFPTYLDFSDYSYLCSQFLKYFAVESDKDINRYAVEEILSITSSLPGVLMEGRPDYWVNYGPEDVMVDIWDWKTNRRLWTQSECEDNIQLKYYTMLVHKALRERPKFYNLAYYFPRHQSIREFTMTADDIAYFEEYITERIRHIMELTEWPAVPNIDNCTYCECWHECPDKEIKEDNILIMAHNIIIYKKKIKEYNSQLKGLVETHGPIELNGNMLDFYLSESVDLFDMPGIIKMMEEAGCEETEISGAKLSKESIKKACKRYKGLWEEIVKKHGKVSKSTRFSWRKCE